MPIPKEILYLTEEDVQQTITVAEAVDLAEKGIGADGAGNVEGDKFYMDVNDDGFIKPFSGYIAGEEYAFVKSFSYFPGNPTKYNRPTTCSQVILLDYETGLPACFMGADWVTGLKTAASTVATTAALARPESEVVTIFGAGTLGRLHLMALAERFKLKQAYFVDIVPEVAEKCSAELQEKLGFAVESVAMDDRKSAVRKSDIVFTVTTGSQELVYFDWLKPGTFVARLGSYQEVHLDVITRADKVILDRWKYVSPRIPEVIQLIEEGKFTRESIHAEWPDIVAGKATGRESEDEIIVFIALGIWGEYAAILPEVYRKAKTKGLGQALPF
ncbi:MAG: ornithine cyclodeaminase family protein [Anaerolineae bacterium]|jgi:ornithine cyclodeaminase|nr:ornithine cyclodeaminase family protein [Anaerolineae bacterium]MBT3714653.1 ornithine cyclodeaminase family protein [Anaerolineae bacterium]MBT4309752.1 ornithine cyclodeaminase family protein [Anaerolineae bacterium]MBT4457973.1 ornithine cyclodeaminase family protein [Anaerolineae bacterium]MBT4841351.1 ornithine cyclodeaminase family protein [Anaerolineae bacterium]